MARAGAAYVDVLPDMKRFGPQLNSQLTKVAREAGQKMGQDAGRAFPQRFESASSSELRAAADRSARGFLSRFQATSSTGARQTADVFVTRFAATTTEGMNRAATEAARSFDSAFTRDVNGRLRDAHGRFVKEFDGISSAANRSFSSMERGSNGFFSRLRSGSKSSAGAAAGAMSMFGKAGPAALALVGGAAVKMGVQFDASLEQSQIAFTNLLGSATKARAFLTDLQKFAAATPFEFPDLTMASQRLLAMGFSAKQVIPTMTAVGDAVAGIGGGKEKIEQVILALGQMRSKQKISTEEMMQLTEAGIPAFQILADKMHMTVPALQDLMQQAQGVGASEIFRKGGLNFLIQGLEHGTKSFKGFAGMMQQQSKSLSGMWSTVKDQTAIALGQLFAPAMPALKIGLRGLIVITGQAGNAIKSISRFVAPAVRDIKAFFVALSGKGKVPPQMAGVAAAAGTIRDRLGSARKVVLDFFGALTGRNSGSKQFKDIATNARGLNRELTGLWSTVRQRVFPVVQNVSGALARNAVPAFRTLARVITRDIIPAAQTMYKRAFAGVSSAVKDVTRALSHHQTQINQVIRFARIMYQVNVQIAGWLYKKLAPILGTTVKIAFQVWGKSIAVVINILADLVSGIVKLYHGFAAMPGHIKKTWSAIRSAFSSSIKWVTSHWHDFWDSTAGTASRTWSRIGSGISGFLDKAARSFRNGASAIGAAWREIENATKKPVNFVIGTVFNQGILNNLWNPIIHWLHLDDLKIKPAKLLARGGTLGDPAPAAPMKTNGPMAIVGEGRPQYPEYVIPTDPRFRGRAQGLWAAAGGDLQMLEGGGILGGVISTIKKVASKVVELGKNGLELLSSPKKVFDRLAGPIVDQIKGIGAGNWGRAVGEVPKKILDHVWDAVKTAVDTFSSVFGSGNASAIVNAARGELGNGEEPAGSNNTKYGRWFHVNPAPWCAEFISYIADKAGVAKLIPKTASAPGMAGGFQQMGEYHSGGSGIRPGDIPFFSAGGGISHVGLAERDLGNGAVGTIEGNHSSVVQRVTRSLGSIVGYGRPKYGSGGGSASATKGGNSPGSAQAFARGQLPEYHWDGSQFSPLQSLWNRESGWRWNARNPSSGAYGIPQSLPGSKMASAGSDWQTNGDTQVIWGLGYIKGRYKTPAGAWAHSQATGWYANGGTAPGGTWGIVGEEGPELINFGGPARIYPHGQSMAMLAGMGGVPGFASGGSITTEAKKKAPKPKPKPKKALSPQSFVNALKKISRDLGVGFLDGITGSLSKIKSVADKIAKDIQYAFQGRKTKLDDRLIKWINKQRDALTKLATKRDSLIAAIKEAKALAADVTSGAKDFGSVTGLPFDSSSGNVFGASGIASGLQVRLGQIKSFAANIKKLVKLGLNKTTLRQIISAGIDQGAPYAAALANTTAAQIKDINGTQKAIDSAANNLGLTSADALYDSGRKAAQGFLKGLEDQQKAIEKQMEKIAKGIVKKLKHDLKIHSPSQVMADLGAQTGAGFALGMEDSLGDISATASAMGALASSMSLAQPVAVAGRSGGFHVEGGFHVHGVNDKPTKRAISDALHDSFVLHRTKF